MSQYFDAEVAYIVLLLDSQRRVVLRRGLIFRTFINHFIESSWCVAGPIFVAQYFARFSCPIFCRPIFVSLLCRVRSCFEPASKISLALEAAEASDRSGLSDEVPCSFAYRALIIPIPPPIEFANIPYISGCLMSSLGIQSVLWCGEIGSILDFVVISSRGMSSSEPLCTLRVHYMLMRSSIVL